MKLNFNSRLQTALRFYLDVKKDRPTNYPVCKAVRYKTGLPAIQILKAYTVGMSIPEILKGMLLYCKLVCIVPIDDMCGNLYGFFYRGLDTKQVRTETYTNPVFYGLHDFKGFKFGMPVILVEGIKDAEAIKQAGYKYSLAILSSKLSDKQVHFLQGLTDKIYIVSDNDYYGKLHANKNMKRLNCKVYTPPEKDLGIIFDKESYRTELFIKAILQTIGG